MKWNLCDFTYAAEEVVHPFYVLWFNEINNRCTSIMVSESLTQGFDFHVFTVYSFGFVMVIVVRPVYYIIGATAFVILASSF